MELLHEAFAALDRSPPPNMESLAAYLDELALWSARTSLTGLSTPSGRVESGVLDALPLADALDASAHLVDVGSGNGLPGLVVAILRPDVRVTLIEPSARRAAFLRTAAAASSAANVTVERTRVEDFGGDPFDAAVSRAAFPLREWLEIGRELVRPGGTVFALAAGDAAGVSAEGLELTDSVKYELPWSGSGRVLLRYVKE